MGRGTGCSMDEHLRKRLLGLLGKAFSLTEGDAMQNTPASLASCGSCVSWSCGSHVVPGRARVQSQGSVPRRSSQGVRNLSPRDITGLLNQPRLTLFLFWETPNVLIFKAFYGGFCCHFFSWRPNWFKGS